MTMHFCDKPRTGWWVWTACSTKARKIAEVAGLDVYATALKQTQGRKQYWYPGWAAELLSIAREVGKEERCYALIAETEKQPGGAREFLAALRTAFDTGGGPAARALFDPAFRRGLG